MPAVASFANPTNSAPAVNPAALQFDLFTGRTLYITGIKGGTPANQLVWSVLARIDCAIVLPA